MINRSEFLELQAFITVATQLSFRAAADTLGVSASAISQHVRALETRLGLRLLHRTTRSVAMTNDGQALFQQAARPFADLKQALKMARARSAMIKGEVHLHAFRSAAELFLDNAIPRFLSAYPDVQLQLTVNDQPADLITGGFDLSLRLGEVLDPGLIAVPCGDALHQIVVASPRYLADHDPLERLEDLVKHNCIRWRWPGKSVAEPWQFYIDDRWATLPVSGNLTVDDRTRLLAAAVAGVGVALVTKEMVQPALDNGSLCRLFAGSEETFQGYYLCWPKGKSMSPAMRELIDWLRGSLTPS